MPFQIAYGYHTLKSSKHAHQDCIMIVDHLDQGLISFAVLDGHWIDGAHAAQRSAELLAQHVRSRKQADFNEIFPSIQEVVHKEMKSSFGGTTVACLVITYDSETDTAAISAANLGDTRAVMLVGSDVERLSVDHNTRNPQEVSRTLNAGCWISKRRLYGQFMVTRALGKHHTPKGVIIQEPFTMEKRVSESFLIIVASDGLWDVMDDKDAASFVRERLNVNLSPPVIARQLVAEASKRWSRDDITCIIIDGKQSMFGNIGAREYPLRGRTAIRALALGPQAQESSLDMETTKVPFTEETANLPLNDGFSIRLNRHGTVVFPCDEAAWDVQVDDTVKLGTPHPGHKKSEESHHRQKLTPLGRVLRFFCRPGAPIPVTKCNVDEFWPRDCPIDDLRGKQF